MATRALAAPSLHASDVLASPSRIATSLAIFAADAAGLVAATFAGTELFRLATGHPPVSLQVWISVIAVILAVYTVHGFYSDPCLSSVEELRRVTLTTSWAYLGLTAAMFLAKDDRMSRGVFLLCWALSVSVVPLCRAAVRKLCSQLQWWGAPAIVFGSEGGVDRAIQLLRSDMAFALRPVGCLLEQARGVQCRRDGVPVVGQLRDSHRIRAITGSRYALVAAEGMDRNRLKEVIEHCSEVFPHVIIVPEAAGWNSAWVSARDLGGVLGLELRHNLLIPSNRALKRTVDVVLGLLAGLVAAPIIAVAAVWIKVVDSGSPFFRHEREGANGRLIVVYKLRTMIKGSDMALLQFLSRSADARAEWERYFKLKQDPRIIKGIGHFLRRTSLDELPQIWNVLRGEMSLVGPRPVVREEIARYEGAFHIVRRVMPGITGLWQVSGRNETTYAERVTLDTYYVRNWSIWLDLIILVKTVRVVLFRTGAY